MLDAIGIFLLFLLAIGGTILVFTKNPIEKLTEDMVGKTHGELNEATKRIWDDLIENRRFGDPVPGFQVAVYVGVGLFYIILVCPFVIIWAIRTQTGSLAVAYFALAVLMLSWVYGIYIGRKKKHVTDDTVIGKQNKVRKLGAKLISGIPELYLWYVFLVVIGVLK